MLIQPYIKGQFQNNAGGQFGLMKQSSFWTGDDIVSLSGFPGGDHENLYFEPNTGTILLQPILRAKDFGTAQVPSRSGGLWRDQLAHSTNRLSLVMYDGTPSVAWSAETTTGFLGANVPFSLDLYMGSPPKGTLDSERNAANIYRRITWPSDSAAGENRWRVTLPYEQTPFLEKSTDAGATWTQKGPLYSKIDLHSLGTAHTVRVSLTCMVIEKEMVLWLGDGFGKLGLVLNDGVGYGSGKILLEGKGGYTSFGFSHVRFKPTGHYVSYKHYGPSDMTVGTDHLPAAPEIHPTATSWEGNPLLKTAPSTYAADGESAVGAIENTYTGPDDRNEFDYRITLTAPDLGGSEAGYAAVTPILRYINVVWPPIYDSPALGDWEDLPPLLSYYEKVSFDPSSRVLRRFFRILCRMYAGEFQPAHGVEAVRFWIGYQHKLENGDYGAEPGSFRGYAIANTDANYFSAGRDGMVSFDANDLFWFLGVQFLPRKVHPARWCVYALVRLLLECAGIVPDLYQTLPKNDGGIDFCEFGPNPTGCSHTKFPPFHPGWEELTPITTCLADCQEIEFAWMGQDRDGQFRFEPFDPAMFSGVAKTFTEQGSGDGEEYDEIGLPGQQGALTRFRSVSGVKNSISLVGVNEADGSLFRVTYRDDASITTRTAPNYTGGFRPYTHASNLYVNPEFAETELERIAAWARLPYEGVSVPCLGQPELWPSVDPAMENKLISVSELRTLGTEAIGYIVLANELSFNSPSTFTSAVTGIWNGQDTAPGAS